MRNLYTLILVFAVMSFSTVLAQDPAAGEGAEDNLVSETTEKTRDRFVNNQADDRKIEVMELEVRPVDVKKEQQMMSKGENLAIIVKIPEADIKMVQKGWEKAIKNKTKSKIQKEMNETWIASTLLTEIYQEPMAVYGKVISTDGGVDVIAFFEIDSVFINQENDDDKVTSASQFMRKFGVEQYRLAVNQQLKDEEKKLKGFKQNLSKLQKENEKLHKTIKANESSILSKESDIEVNISDQVLKGKEVEKYKHEVSEAGSPEKEQIAKKSLKTKEKEKKKLQKKNQDMHKDIAKFKADIEKAKRAIQHNLDLQAMENEAIKTQMVMVRAVANKLDKIK